MFVVPWGFPIDISSVFLTLFLRSTAPAPCDKVVWLRVHRSKQPCICARPGFKVHGCGLQHKRGFTAPEAKAQLLPGRTLKQTAEPCLASRREKHEVFGFRLRSCRGTRWTPVFRRRIFPPVFRIELLPPENGDTAFFRNTYRTIRGGSINHHGRGLSDLTNCTPFCERSYVQHAKVN